MALDLEFTFDTNTYRHYMNGFLSVMHCHHYMGLLTKLADDFDDLGGTNILAQTAEDTIRPLLDDYITKHELISPKEKMDVGRQYYSVMGMGKMKISGGQNGGSVELTTSHIDQGWIKKWKKTDKPVNFWTLGYICAMFCAAFDKPARSYDVKETASIVKGDKISKFSITAN